MALVQLLALSYGIWTSWQARPDLHIGLNLFRYKMKDIIRLAGTPATYRNTSDQRGSGFARIR